MKNKSWVFLGLCIIAFIMWIVSWFIPFWIQPGRCTLDFYSVLFTAINALFTGGAFGVTFYSIHKQQKALQEQQHLQMEHLRLNVFFNSIKLVLDNDKFINCKNYIFDKNKYDKDMTSLMRATKNENISLVAIEKILENKYEGNLNKKIISEERIRNLYDNITFFCARMNLLGCVSKDNTSVSLIMDYYERTITTSYKKLKRFIEATNADLHGIEPYKEFTNLYNKAEQSKKRSSS